MMHMTFVQLVLSWMVFLQPPEQTTWADRYVEVAQATVEACSRTIGEGEILTSARSAPETHLTCLAVMTAVAFHESRFNPEAVGDGGRSIGPWQVSKAWLRKGEDTFGQAVVAEGLMRKSAKICKGRPRAEQLGWYASGGAKCGRPESSRIRMSLAAKLVHLDR